MGFNKIRCNRIWSQSIVFIFLLLLSFSLFPSLAHSDRWDNENDPRRFGPGLVFKRGELPATGEVTDIPWAGYRWPVYQDSINVWWNASGPMSAAEKYGFSFGVPGVEDAVSANYGIDNWSSRPACTDASQCDAGLGEVCASRRGGVEGRCIPVWWGICHGWAAAAIFEPEPQHSVVYQGVTFNVNDIKALVSLSYDRTTSEMVGTRCNENNAAGEIAYDASGRIISSQCRDVNPGSLHVLLSNFLGIRKQAMVEDRVFDLEIWSRPIRGFEILESLEMNEQQAKELLNVGNAPDYPFNADADRFFYVQTEVRYVDVAPMETDGNLSGVIDQYSKEDVYSYLLELDGDGNIIGGEWLPSSRNNHPDFLWLPVGRTGDSVADGAITYEKVKMLLDQSIAPLGNASKALPLISLLLLGQETAKDFWVDAVNGSDSNPGSEEEPLQTISHALQVAAKNSTIHVLPGTYSESQGEVFPLVLQPGQALIGDTINRGSGASPTLVVGHGDSGMEYQPGTNYSATIVGAEGARVAGLKIGEDAAYLLHFAIVAAQVSMEVDNNTFQEETYGGVLLNGEGHSLIHENDFATSSYGVYLGFCPGGSEIYLNNFAEVTIPVDVVGSNTYAVVKENTITGNGLLGVQVQHGYPLIQRNLFNRAAGYSLGAIRCRFSSAEPAIRGNTFNGGPAVIINDGAPDMGSFMMLGKNDFTMLTGASVIHAGAAQLFAIGNSWPHSPPVCGTDILTLGTGSVTWSTTGQKCP